MNYSGNSYKIVYQNNQFDSIGELTWYLFLNATGITSNITTQPLEYKKDLAWYPDLYFPIFKPTYYKVYFEVKPLAKEEFHKQLNLEKYKVSDGIACILGSSFCDYLILEDEQKLITHFDSFFLENQTKWNEAKKAAEDFAHKYGTFQKGNIEKKEIRLTIGQYKGYTLTEIKQMDKKYYDWYIETFDTFV